MSLEEYKKKRNFKKTPEPRPKKSGRRTAAGSPLYVIQRHQASHLHWDLRLEEDGVLKSWAVPKEPSREEGVRRLAVAVEDHTLEYGNFEGTIPEGEYGAGQVKIWDKGTYIPVETSAVKRIFEIKGRRLSGTYALVKLKTNEAKDKNWLFFKLKSRPGPGRERP